MITDINELKAAKEKAEKGIKEILLKFHEETGYTCGVEGYTYSRRYRNPYGQDVTIVEEAYVEVNPKIFA